MNQQRRGTFRAIAAAILFAVAVAVAGGFAHAADEVKIGFLVKQPEAPWFQDEWKFADQAAREKGFKLVKIGVPSGGEVLTAIDNLGAQHAQGFVICVPDVKLGPAVVAKARQNNLKLMTVDDRLADGGGKPIEAVPHMGISATRIGEQVGEAIAQEMKTRGWNPAEVGAIRIAYDQLRTARERTDGAVAALAEASFAAAPDPETERRQADLLPCKRIGEPAAVAHTALFRASDAARFINAADILIDGGRSQRYHA
ncbi:SDR family oxidoreductase [Ralstonia pseudosolanacearum]|uniref:SDR family oxidoreductase n=1 Tax=Ralstonia pseudosolanacearum TaxID=1310165 RepID=UPI001FFB0CAD|nr:SDR family oxidoreductase [Ralstonia pseudosolanacearum]